MKNKKTSLKNKFLSTNSSFNTSLFTNPLFNKSNLFYFFISLLLVILTIFIGSYFTSGSVNSEWYDSVKPSITPPNYVFPIVWTTLFFMIFLSFFISLIYSKDGERKKVYFLFILNLILNVLWSLIYFGLRNPLLAFFEIFLLWFSILLIMVFSWRINKLAGLLLLPYFVWVSFAAFLNFLSI
jgi:translocator protein